MNPFRRFPLGRYAVLIVGLVLALVIAQSGWLRSVEDGQHALIASLHKKTASQQLHIVEIDAQSLAQVKQWPWSRVHYARLVRRLNDAGARSIVFDIDFASPSSVEGDAAFANAIEDADTAIIMPTFSQEVSEGADEFVDALPIDLFRANTGLASASVRAGPDARVRRMVYGTVTNGVPRPSLSAQIANASGAVDASYAIDFSIDPASIPRHSFTAVENGDFNAADVAGKDILVGATAIELGDRYGVPIHGVIPGVTIHALAAETLMGGSFAEFGWVPALLIAGVFAFLISGAVSYQEILLRSLAGAVSIIAMQVTAYYGGRAIVQIMPSLIFIVLTVAGQTLRIERASLLSKSLTDTETGLPNAVAFDRADHAGTQFVVTAYIRDFNAIQTVIGQNEIGTLIERLIDRMRSVVDIDVIYRADTRILAWNHMGDYQAPIEHFKIFEHALRKPVEVAGKRIDVSLAFGIASGFDLPGAMRAASSAAFEGKIWNAHEDAEAVILEQRVSLMGELDEAVETGQLTVVYQPKLRLKSNRIESVEALVRWNHPVHGRLSPDVFIPLAEDSNRIEGLTLYVLEKTIKDMRKWGASGVSISAAVNISAKLVSSEAFFAKAEKALLNSGVLREQLIFEVTESAAMANPDAAVQNLKRFRDLGVAISMDDYGTGHSTLSYIQKLPLTELKIDRAFVQNAHIERSDALLVRSTIQLAHSLGLRVVAEGVEEEQCLEFLRETGCDYVQGYFISKPLEAGLLGALVAGECEPVLA